MADTTNTVATLEGLFKEVYAKNVESLVPGTAKCAQKIPFVPVEEREGLSLNFPVALTRAHGFVLAGSGTDVFDLPDAEAAIHKNASVKGIQFLLKETVSFRAMAKALGYEGEARTRAFVQATKHVVENMLESTAFVREIQLLHGGGDGSEAANVGGIGVVSSVSGSGPYDVVLTEESWASGIWAGMENGYVDAYDTTLATKRNSGDLQVTGVDIDNRTIELTGTQSGLTGTDVLYFRGSQANEMAGLKRSITNSGTLHGISAANYNLWGGNSLAAGSAAFTFQKLLSAINKAVNRGLSEDVCCMISPVTWSDLLDDLSSLRRYADRAGGSLEQGANHLKFYSQNGSIEIIPHLFMKQGEACVFPHGRVVRVGATDITFQLPGGTDKFLQPLEGKSAYQMCCYWLQGLVVKQPAKCVYVTGIVNGT